MEFSSTPATRFQHVLLELAAADQVRSLQTMYRDGYDQQMVGIDIRRSIHNRKKKFPSFPSSVALDTKTAMKDLLYQITEGRSRAIALAKLCHGDRSLPFIRAVTDLANAYALQGMWAQAEEKIIVAWAKMISYEEASSQHKSVRDKKSAEAIDAAKKIQIVYATLRRHVINNCGQVKRTLIDELSVVLPDTDNELSASPAPSRITDSAPKVSSTAQFLAGLEDLFRPNKSKIPLKQLTASYFHDQQPYHAEPSASNKEEMKTWSQAVDFFRAKSPIMQKWVATVDEVLLPQSKAVLLVPFSSCDQEDRKVAHPHHLSSIFLQYPSAMKLISGSTFLKSLEKLPVEVPLVIAPTEPSTADIPVPPVSYNLPITVEEYLSLYLLENIGIGMEFADRLLKMQILTVKGLCAVHLQGQIDSADETLKKALKELEACGMEMELVACELYNAISQMMIARYQIWQSTKKQRYRQEAEEWLISGTTEANKALKNQMKLVKKQYDYKSFPVSHAEMEYEAKQLLIKKKIKELYDQNDDGSQIKAFLDAASRYLMKTVDIWEANHGESTMALATACMAVASVSHMSKTHEETRSWLLKALRIFERQAGFQDGFACALPLPIRAIAFTHTQLSQTLEALSFEGESKQMLLQAYRHYMDEAKALLEERAVQGNSGAGLEATTGTGASGRPTGIRGAAAVGPTAIAAAATTTAGGTSGGAALSATLTHGFIAPGQGVTNTNHYDHLLPNKAQYYVGNVPLILHHSEMEAILGAASQATQQVIAFCKRTQRDTANYEISMYLEDLASLLEAGYGWDSIESAEAYRQAGQRCLLAGDLTRAAKHLQTALHAYQTIYGGQGVADGARIITGLTKAIDRVKTMKREGRMGTTIADTDPLHTMFTNDALNMNLDPPEMVPAVKAYRPLHDDVDDDDDNDDNGHLAGADDDLAAQETLYQRPEAPKVKVYRGMDDSTDDASHGMGMGMGMGIDVLGGAGNRGLGSASSGEEGLGDAAGGTSSPPLSPKEAKVPPVATADAVGAAVASPPMTTRTTDATLHEASSIAPADSLADQWEVKMTVAGSEQFPTANGGGPGNRTGQAAKTPSSPAKPTAAGAAAPASSSSSAAAVTMKSPSRDAYDNTMISPTRIGRVVEDALSHHSKFVEGDRVLVDPKDIGKWNLATIKLDRRDGTYDVDYDDGEMATRIKEKLIRKQRNPTMLQQSFQGSDGLFDSKALLAIGEEPTAAPVPATAPTDPTPTTTLKEGDKVEANYKGRGKFYPGRVRKVHASGALDVDYDDGEVEREVSAELVRLFPGAVVATALESDGSAAVEAAVPVAEMVAFEEYDEVEVGRADGSFVPGLISRDNGDGTYDVDLESGDTEVKVPARSIRKKA